MPSRKIEEQLERLKSLRGKAPTEACTVALCKALSDRVNLVTAKAAEISAELQLNALIPDLLKAFDRLFENPVKSDPQCWGKNALAKALKSLGYNESKPFLRGLHYVQMEPVWGSEVDTAATLRATCTLALLQCADLTREDKLWHAMRGLTDADPTVRGDAARALRELDGIEAALLLRLKARMGDRADITGQTLGSLLGIEGEAAVPFVAEFLESRDDEVREEAALVLGASRLAAAVSCLIDKWKDNRRGASSSVLLRAISASRQESALAFLLDVVRNGSERDAREAAEALQLHRDSPKIQSRVKNALEGRESRASST